MSQTDCSPYSRDVRLPGIRVRISQRAGLWLLALCLPAAVMSQQVQVAGISGRSLYVSPEGQDDWSGKLPTVNADHSDGPLRTLTRARDLVRTWLEEDLPEGEIHVVLRGGEYPLSEPVVLGPRDSGRKGLPIVYQSYPGERAWISGGREIPGWREVRENGVRYWKTTIPDVAEGKWFFRQLFIRHTDREVFERRFRPCRGMLTIAGTTWSPARKSMSHRAAQQDILVFPEDLAVMNNFSRIEFVALHSWSASRLRIESIDPSSCTVRFTSVPTFRIGHWYQHGYNPYFLENLEQDLDEPGEWFLNSTTGELTYLPRNDETIDGVVLVAPRLEKLLVVRGERDGAGPVRYVSFQGLGFRHSEWLLPMEGYDVSQGQPQLPAAVEVADAGEIHFTRCIIAHTGAYGATLGTGTHDCSMTGCLLADLGGGGIKVGDSRMNRHAVAPVLPSGNRLENNTITDTGMIHFSANGIWCGVVRDVCIRHNEVRNNPYSGIAVGWCWDNRPSSCGGNIIEFNHVHHVMQLVQDGGCIYTLGNQPGTVVRGNLLHDSLPSPFACRPGQCGLYFDQGSAGFTVADNIQYHVAWEPNGITQNQNTAADHDIRTNYLGIPPDDPRFPAGIAAKAGVEDPWRWQPDDLVPVTANPVYAMSWQKPPPPPKGFNIDFEEIPVGYWPRGFSRNGLSGDALLEVTDEIAFSGHHSLKFCDRAGLPKSFYPYLSRGEIDVTEGPVEFSCRVYRDPDKMGGLWIELRDYKSSEPGSYWAGPSLGVSPDGRVIPYGQDTIAVISPKTWATVTIRFALGKERTTDWELTVVSGDDAPVTRQIPFVKEQFRQLTNLVMCADQDADGLIYIDDLSLLVPR